MTGPQKKLAIFNKQVYKQEHLERWQSGRMRQTRSRRRCGASNLLVQTVRLNEQQIERCRTDVNRWFRLEKIAGKWRDGRVVECGRLALEEDAEHQTCWFKRYV